jgi:anti-sigma regulatory factor (Ser/Thr protein kinase)
VSVSATQELGPLDAPGGFRHEALLYAGDAEFVDRASSFIRDGLDAEEPVLVVVSAEKIAALRSELGGRASEVRFADMFEVGANPARIIPAWQAFVDEHGGRDRPVRGIGEPIWAARSADELVECERHEGLLNLAFADGPAWWLLCPYDTRTLAAPVLDEARRNHPTMLDAGGHHRTAEFRGLEAIEAPFNAPLPEPPVKLDELPFVGHDLATLRAWVDAHAARSGLGPSRTEDLVLAVNEIVTNSVRHGGGGGILRMWETTDTVVSEITDHGQIDLPMIGREQPTLDQTSGFGLWIANQVCDLVQVRTFPGRSVVRLHMRPD